MELFLILYNHANNLHYFIDLIDEMIGLLDTNLIQSIIKGKDTGKRKYNENILITNMMSLFPDDNGIKVISLVIYTRWLL